MIKSIKQNLEIETQKTQNFMQNEQKIVEIKKQNADFSKKMPEENSSILAKESAEKSSKNTNFGLEKTELSLQKKSTNNTINDILYMENEEANPTIDDIPIFDYQDTKPNERKIDFSNLGALTPRKIWGVILVKLREQHYMTLHTAGGEVRDISSEGNKIVAKVRQEYLFKILTQEENYAKICQELKQIDPSLSIEFVYNPPKIKDGVANLPKLKALFGDFLKVRE